MGEIRPPGPEVRRREQEIERGLAAIDLKQHDDVERQKGFLGGTSLYWNAGFKRGPAE